MKDKRLPYHNKFFSALPTVLIAVGVIIVITVLCITTVVSVVCFIVLSKRKTAGEFIIIEITHNTINDDIFLSSVPTTGRGTSQW